MKQYTASFTGHRIIAREDLATLPQRLDETIASLIQQGIVYFGSGYARGFDTLAAQAVLRARDKNDAVKLIAVLPCTDQSEKWPEADQEVYWKLLTVADKVVCVINRPYEDDCMKKRNLRLITHNSVCITYMKHWRSGTAQTVRMAVAQGLTVINLAE